MLPADRSKVPCGYCDNPVGFVSILSRNAGLLLLPDDSSEFDQLKRV